MDKPLLIDAITGNSRMLVTFDRQGQLHHLFWPDIDRHQQVGKTLLGLFLTGRREETLWLSGHAWEHHQEYQGDTAILRTTGVHREAGMAFLCTDFCVPGRPLLVRRLRFVNQGQGEVHPVFLHYAALDLEGSPQLNACYYHAGAGALVYYRQHTVCALGFDRPVSGYTCGREQTDGAALWDAFDGHLNGRGIEMGDVDGCLACDLGRLGPGEAAEVDVFWYWASGRAEALAGLEEARRSGAERLARETARFWKQWLSRGLTAPSHNETLDRLFRRSLITIKLLSNSEHGGIIAAPEADPGFVGSGGYGYCWPRDAVWVATALTEAGHAEEAEGFYRWAREAQEPEGCWYQRYYCDGSLAPSWGLLQGDETASVVFGVFHHFALTHDLALLRELWPMVRRATEFLRRTLDPCTGLPGPSIDLWEERLEESAYAAAATFGAFTGAAYLARELNQPTEAGEYQKEADRLRETILTRLWHPPDDRFLRGLLRRISRGEYLHRRACGEEVCETHDSGLYAAYAELLDRGLDVSLLGLAVPFGVLSPSDPRMRATAGQIARVLENPRVGGIHRYPGDSYRGGNPWMVCTLWLGLYELAQGEVERARQRLDWAVAHRTPLDLLPEQVNRETGAPFWIVPLSWSHAMFIHLLLALRRRGAFHR
ncbi:MAG: glycoside hydrolase family 15 protein [Bacillota bacterium]|nr:glycoside hydrolase family 15 protein [Bacillota bacterium]